MSDRMSIERAAEQIRHRYGPALEVLENEEVEFVAIHPADTDAGRAQVERVAKAMSAQTAGYPEAFDSFLDSARAALDALKESS